MKVKQATSTAYRRARPRSASLVHELNNSLGALRLRVELLAKDSTCRWAQGPALDAISRIVEEAQQTASQLAQRTGVTRRRRSPR